MPESQVFFPQLIDPRLDYFTYLFLSSLNRSALHIGLKHARSTLADRTKPKPMMVIICTNAYGALMEEQLAALLRDATLAGVPAVHSLSRRNLGQACGAKHCVSVVTVSGTLDERAHRMAVGVMDRAAVAYADFLALACSAPPPMPAAPRGLSPDLPPCAVSPALSPCAVSLSAAIVAGCM